MKKKMEPYISIRSLHIRRKGSGNLAWIDDNRSTEGREAHEREVAEDEGTANPGGASQAQPALHENEHSGVVDEAHQRNHGDHG